MAWAKPKLLASVDQAIIREVSAASYRDEVVVVATASPRAADWQNRRLLVVGPADSTYRWNPRGDFVFVAPRIAFDSSGTLHMFWGEPKGRDPQSKIAAVERGFVTQIWHSAHRTGKAWDAPSLAYESSRKLYWNSDLAQVKAVDGEVKAIVADIAVPFSIVVMTTNSDRLNADRYPTAVGAYTSITGTPIGDVAAYMAPDPMPPSVGNSVFVKRLSSDLTPVRVQRSEDGAATMVLIGRRAQGGVIVIWGQNHGGGLFADGVRYAKSPDFGLTWELPITFAREPNGISNLQLVEGIGCTRAVYLVKGLSAGRLWNLREETWNRAGDIPVPVGTHLIATATGKEGELFLVASSEEAAGTGHLWLVDGAPNQPPAR